MSYLYEFIRSLNEKDKLRLENLPLVGKERDVVDYLTEGQTPELDVVKACAALEISRSHFDKISSLVLNKCYADFVPEGGPVLIGKLLTRGLVRHALHQVKQTEKSWKKSPPDIADREFFYEKVFRTVCRLPAQTENKKEMVNGYGKQFIESISDKKRRAVYSVFVQSRTVICEVEFEGVTKKLELPATHKKFEKKLRALVSEAATIKDPFAICQANMANIFFYNLVDPEKSLPFLEGSFKLLSKIKDELDESEKINFHLKYGESLFYLSRFEEAYKVFKPFFDDEKTHKVIVNAMRSKFIQLCIITGRLPAAEDEMAYVYAQSSEEQVHSFTLMYVLSSIKLYLLWGKYERAFDYIQLMKGRISKNILVNYEVELRNLETAYFYLMGDHNFAAYIARKNLKFFASKKEMKASPQVGNFSRIVTRLVQERLKKNSTYDYKSDEKFEMYKSRELAFYERILEKME